MMLSSMLTSLFELLSGQDCACTFIYLTNNELNKKKTNKQTNKKNVSWHLFSLAIVCAIESEKWLQVLPPSRASSLCWICMEMLTPNKFYLGFKSKNVCTCKSSILKKMHLCMDVKKGKSNYNCHL